MGDLQVTILIHGGAWAIPDYLAKDSVDGVKAAAKVGYTILRRQDGTALDAVEAAVCSLEDNPAFDAGTGAVLNAEGEVELDAIIMEGKDLNAGSIACVRNIKNPVKLARMVMEKTEHVMIAGRGANLFAKEMGVPEVPMSELITSDAEAVHTKYDTRYSAAVNDFFNKHGSSNGPGHDTVGAVAIDRHGNVACATSTGGISEKRVGRVGDSPIIGCGAYCDNAYGAVSTTGHGESIMKVTLSRLVLQYMASGMSPQQATEKGLEYMRQRVGGCGGVIAINNRGVVGKHFNTERMPWATISNDQMQYGIEPTDHFEEEITNSE